MPLERRATAERAVAAELSDVVMRFPGAGRAVLDGLSWKFDAGTFTAVVGRSGSGKTTLLHLLAGLERQTAGEVLVDGRELGALSRAEAADLRRRQIALVTQEPGLVLHLSALENVELGLLVRGGGETRGGVAPKPSNASASGAAWTTAPTASRQASGSGSRSPAPSRRGRGSCSRTSPPPASTRRTRDRSASSSRDWLTTAARPSSARPTTPR